MKVNLICVGKLKNQALSILFQDYLRRIKHYAKVNCREIKDATSQQEGKLLLEHSEGTFRIMLSAEGKQMTSEVFSKFLKDRTREVSFIIGGPEGLSPEVKKNADVLLSLSPMTFPHELCRVLLVEQIYRTHTIINKERYHK